MNDEWMKEHLGIDTSDMEECKHMMFAHILNSYGVALVNTTPVSKEDFSYFIEIFLVSLNRIGFDVDKVTTYADKLRGLSAEMRQEMVKNAFSNTTMESADVDT